jgi:hypothetical protein
VFALSGSGKCAIDSTGRAAAGCSGGVTMKRQQGLAGLSKEAE